MLYTRVFQCSEGTPTCYATGWFPEYMLYNQLAGRTDSSVTTHYTAGFCFLFETYVSLRTLRSPFHLIPNPRRCFARGENSLPVFVWITRTNDQTMHCELTKYVLNLVTFILKILNLIRLKQVLREKKIGVR